MADEKSKPKKALACPKWLEPDAKREWKRLVKKMDAIGVLTEIDMVAFAGYCQAYARWKQAEERITDGGAAFRTPSGISVQSPHVAVAQHYMKLMLKFAEQLGLTPAARNQIIAGNDEED